MKKEEKDERSFCNKNTSLYVSVGVLVAVLLVFAFSGFQPVRKDITGAAVQGVSITNPVKSSSGYSVSYDLTMSPDVTAKLKGRSDRITFAATITDAVNQANGLAQDGLKSLLGLPSIPDTFGILAGIAGWLNNNADACLRDIGDKFAGKEFKGKYYYSVSKGAGSRLYPDWDYYYATSTYTGPQGFNCKQKLGCVFSFNPKTKEISKSCFG